jgi:hypothetical protein
VSLPPATACEDLAGDLADVLVAGLPDGFPGDLADGLLAIDEVFKRLREYQNECRKRIKKRNIHLFSNARLLGLNLDPTTNAEAIEKSKYQRYYLEGGLVTTEATSGCSVSELRVKIRIYQREK